MFALAKYPPLALVSAVEMFGIRCKRFSEYKFNN